jgi:hypothetical protein
MGTSAILSPRNGAAEVQEEADEAWHRSASDDACRQPAATRRPFIGAVTPSQMRFNSPNKYYASDEAYLEAAGNALRPGYQAIVEAGFDLQLDSSDLAMRAHGFSDDAGPMDVKKWSPWGSRRSITRRAACRRRRFAFISAGATMPGRTTTT